MTASPPVPLGDGAPVIAFDVGGTDTKAAIVDDSGRIRELLRVPTPEGSGDAAERVVREIATVASRLRALHPDVEPLAAGLLVPGIVDSVSGVGVYSENLGWRDYPFRERAAEALALPVAFDHDVRAAGEAERRLGAAAGFDDVIVVTIGTGIAAAIFIDGRAHPAGGFAGEIGHLRVADGPICSCGASGCLEAVASAAALVRRYRAATSVSLRGAEELITLAAAGDVEALRIWESALDALAFALSACVAVLAPAAIVIGGGLSAAGDDLIVPLRERLDRLLTYQRRPAILRARAGGDAGLLGAILTARDLAEACSA